MAQEAGLQNQSKPLEDTPVFMWAIDYKDAAGSMRLYYTTKELAEAAAREFKADKVVAIHVS